MEDVGHYTPLDDEDRPLLLLGGPDELLGSPEELLEGGPLLLEDSPELDDDGADELLDDGPLLEGADELPLDESPLDEPDELPPEELGCPLDEPDELPLEEPLLEELPLDELACGVTVKPGPSRTQTRVSAVLARRTHLPSTLFPSATSVATRAAAFQKTMAPTVMRPADFGKSNTPSTASAPFWPAAMSAVATPTKSPSTTTSPTATSLGGV